MTEPAIFVEKPSGRIEVMLGVHLIGVIEPWPLACQGRNLGRVGAHFSIMLPEDGPRSPFPATSVSTARRLILGRLSAWFEAAGPLFASTAAELGMQAIREGELVI